MFDRGFKKIAAIQDDLGDTEIPREPSGDKEEKPKDKKKVKSGGPVCPAISVMASSYPR